MIASWKWNVVVFFGGPICIARRFHSFQWNVRGLFHSRSCSVGTYYQLDFEIPQRSPRAAISRKRSRESRENLKTPRPLPVRGHRLRDRVGELSRGRALILCWKESLIHWGRDWLWNKEESCTRSIWFLWTEERRWRSRWTRLFISKKKNSWTKGFCSLVVTSQSACFSKVNL
jgi:hypothetical protein